MWKEELDKIIKEGGIHDIEYQLKDGDVVTFIIKGVSYYGQYSIVANSRTLSDSSFWKERQFTISKIKTIDNVPFNQSIAQKNFQRKQEEERRIKEMKKPHNTYTSTSNNLTEMKLGAMAFLGFLGLMFGGAAGGGIGAICGVVIGALAGLWLIEARYNE
jgi:hypothetical protein